MTEDGILKLAEDAGCGWRRNGTQPVLVTDGMILGFARLVTAAERERCAKVCEAQTARVALNHPARVEYDPDSTMARKCAIAIRALGDDK